MEIGPSLIQKVEPVDIAGAMNKGATARLNIAKSNQQVGQIDDEAHFTQALKEYQAYGGDLATPEGIDKALQDLKGRVSPDHYMKLADYGNKSKEAAAKYRQTVMQLADADKKRELDDLEQLSKVIAPLSEKPLPPEQWTVARDAALQQFAQQKLPTGQPRWNQQAMSYLQSLDQPAFRNWSEMTNWKKQQILNNKTVADTKKSERLAEESQLRSDNMALGLGPEEQWTGPGGEAIVKSTKTGQVFAIDKDGERTAIPAIPLGSQKMGSKAGDTAVQQQKLLDFTAMPPTPEEERIAREYNVTRRMPSLGQTSPLRPRIVMLAARLAIQEGSSGLADNARFKAEASSVANLTKQYGVIKSGEDTILKNLKLMEGIIDKVDQTGIPVLERWIRAGRRAVEGDADVAKLDSLIISTQADIGKVLSATTGAAGTPVAALKEAQKYFNSNMTREQFAAMQDIIPKEMTARTLSMEEQIAKSISNITKLTQRGSARVTPAEQAARDAPAVEIQRAELEKTRREYRAATDPAVKARLNSDITSLEREIARATGGKPPAESSPQADGPDVAVPQVGEVRKGYRYKGGNPADRGSWEKAQ